MLSLVGPAGDRGRGAELQVIGMGDDGESPIPFLAVSGSKRSSRELSDTQTSSNSGGVS
jgi:hypothetical protein